MYRSALWCGCMPRSVPLCSVALVEWVLCFERVEISFSKFTIPPSTAVQLLYSCTVATEGRAKGERARAEGSCTRTRAVTWYLRVSCAYLESRGCNHSVITRGAQSVIITGGN